MFYSFAIIYVGIGLKGYIMLYSFLNNINNNIGQW